MVKYLMVVFIIFGFAVFIIVYLTSRADVDKKFVSNKEVIMKKKFGKVLVVYYSLSGNTRSIAMKIKEKTNADICEIETVKKYPSLPMLYFTAKRQTKPKNYPELKNEFPDFSQYDLIFVGSPTWWYTVSAPVLSFLYKADFKGKTVISFTTNGGNCGTFFEDFEQSAKNAKVIKGIEFKKVSKQDVNILDNTISGWLNNLDI